MQEDRLLVLLLLLLHRSFSIAVENIQCTASCGEVTNISKPFRLRGYPKDCGDHELACIDKRTVLDLYLGKYYVRSIDYNNFTIRIANVGLQKSDCSSLPLRSLSCHDVSYGQDEYSCSYQRPRLYKTVAVVDCIKVINSRYYVDASLCLDGAKFLNFSHTRGQVYAMVDANVSDVEATCTIELMAIIPWWADGDNLRSYAQVHEHMVHGFELSWLPIACETYCNQRFGCKINDKHQIQCDGGQIDLCLPYIRCIVYPGIASFAGKIGLYLLYIGWDMQMLSLYGIVLFVVVKFILGAPPVMILLICKWRRRHLAMDQNVEEFLQSNNNFLPMRYSYSGIKKITGHLKDKLGEGGYGSVFKGRLRSGREVAVKILKKGKANGQDFISEIATIGRIYHVNVVGLIGFCFEGSKQALVYDFMHNESLDKHIFSQEQGTSLHRKKVYKIALGVARGIEYLHRGCDMQILHFDIKPHNILLDRDFVGASECHLEGGEYVI